MARMEFSLEHGQPAESAQAKFEAGMAEAISRYGSWIGRADWSEDRHAVTISGTGYEMRLWYDDRYLHARGQVPLAWKLFEPAVRQRIRQMLEDGA